MWYDTDGDGPASGRATRKWLPSPRHGSARTSPLWSSGPVWLGFGEGYGGTVFASQRVTLASGLYAGLRAYASILERTWVGHRRSRRPEPGRPRGGGGRHHRHVARYRRGPSGTERHRLPADPRNVVARCWLQADHTGTAAPALRFRPGVPVNGRTLLNIGDRITATLTLPEPARLQALRAIESAAAAVLSGTFTPGQAAAAPRKAGVPL